MKEVMVSSLQETNTLAKDIADVLQVPSLLTLSGDLGAGKTTFTKALAAALGFSKTITSPTFTIQKSYEENGLVLHHIDAYRLEGMKQDLGFEEIFDEEAICVVEWATFIDYALPKERVDIQIKVDGEDRIFIISAIGSKYQKVVEVL